MRFVFARCARSAFSNLKRNRTEFGLHSTPLGSLEAMYDPDREYETARVSTLATQIYPTHANLAAAAPLIPVS